VRDRLTPSVPSNPPSPAVSVVLCTYNRSSLLADALDALVNQADGTPPYEVIVVDNNSSDGTRDVIERLSASGLVRYGFEPRQGLSLARNHGVSLARADLFAFTDDDVRVSPTWIRSIVQAFVDSPDAGMVGGRVEPVWEAAPPSWLPETGDAPLALANFGDEPFRITPDRPVCLIGANVAVRRRVFDRTGGFSTDVQRVRDGIGSTEDYDFQRRALSLGVCARYDPRVLVRAPVPRERLMKQYHRAWHRGHGRFYALMRDPSFERSRLGSFLGVPAHVYRSALREAAGWSASLLSRRRAAAFAHELRLRFLIGFAVQRISERP
jgi:glycosyltransferase involved in cell wall biosynthesis